MKIKSAQMRTGKAFEYAILSEFHSKLKNVTNVKIIKNDALETALNCFNDFKETEQGEFLLYASFAINFLIDVEPRLSNDINENDTLELEIVTDYKGQLGDVRDVLAIRLLQKWEIGISAKNNHKAVKHSRLSNDIDFGKKWLGLNCSKDYFDSIYPVFNELKSLREKSNKSKTWKSLGDYHKSVYLPILNSFKVELNRLYNKNNHLVASQLIQYLVGTKDFYKVIKKKKLLEIQAYNFKGSLNKSFETINPKFKIPIIELPTEIIDISFKKNSETTLIVKFNKGWGLSFRIHNASSRIEPSLKFDINLTESPKTLFTNKLSVKDS
jgi:hypothetical protein